MEVSLDSTLLNTNSSYQDNFIKVNNSSGRKKLTSIEKATNASL